jgi:hypothetical protein
MTAILLAALAVKTFGAFAVSLRWALRRQPSAALGAFGSS